MEQLEAGAIGRMEEEARCWQAVPARDPQADGCFYYAVRSTGIYRRPSCPSRQPARKQGRTRASSGLRLTARR